MGITHVMSLDKSYNGVNNINQMNEVNEVNVVNGTRETLI